MPSSKFQINQADLEKILNNALIFFAPLVLMYLYFVVANISTNNISIASFIPTQAVIGASALYILNVLIDFFRKYAKDNRIPQISQDTTQ